MKILALIVQNKKGVNIFVITTNNFSSKLALHHSRSIYDFIIKQFKSGKKIERSFLLDSSITCICNITKEFIIACLISNYRGIFAGYDALKKANDLFKQYNKNNLLEKKFPELYSIFDEFLYTREFRLSKLTINFSKLIIDNKPNNPEFTPLKKIADCDIFDKFQHVTSELEKNMIANIPLKYAKKQLTQDREDKYINLMNEFHRLKNQNFIKDLTLNPKIKSANFRFAFKCATIYRKKDSNYKRSSGYDFKKSIKQINMPVNNNVSYVGFSNEEFKKIIKSSDSTKVSMNANNKEKDNDDNLIDLEYTRTSNFSINAKKESFTSNKGYPPVNVQNIDLLNDDILENNEEYRYSKASVGSYVDQNNFDNVSNFNQNSTNNFQKQTAASTNVDLLIFDEADHQIHSETTPKTSILNANIILKILEKTIIMLQNGKIRELKIFGQLLIEGDMSKNKFIVKLINQLWEDSQYLQKRVTPNSLEVNQIGSFLYEVAFGGQSTTKPKSIFDYIVSSKHFKIEKIPLMVIYKSFQSEKNKNDVIVSIQYKVNENINMELKDVEIEVVLDKEIFFDDIQTIPPAHSFQNKVLLWKINDLYANNKGKLQLVVVNSHKDSSKMIEYIKIIFNIKFIVLNEIDAEVTLSPDGITKKAEKKSIYEYKIMPNSI